MPLTANQSQRISLAIGQKVISPCPLCGARAWAWGSDLVVLQTNRYETLAEYFTPLTQIGPLDKLRDMGILAPHPQPQAVFSTPPAYPTLPLMCNNCGNTMFLNVYALGISDLWPEISAGRAG